MNLKVNLYWVGDRKMTYKLECWKMLWENTKTVVMKLLSSLRWLLLLLNLNRSSFKAVLSTTNFIMNPFQSLKLYMYYNV